MLNSYLTNHIKLTTLVVIALCCAISQSTVEGRAARMSDFVGKGAHCISVKRDYHHHPSLAEQQQQEEEDEEAEDSFEVEQKRNSYKHNRNSSRSGYEIGCNPDTDGYPCLFADSCGKFDISARHKYIVGGKDALPGDVPSHVMLEFPGGAGSGVLISDWHVATAAHTVLGQDYSKMLVHAGSVLKPSLPDRDRQTRLVDQICYPRNFVYKLGQSNDFAIIKLQSPVIMGSFVKAACWPYEGRGEINVGGDDAQCFLAGFGNYGYDTSGNGLLPDTMQKFRYKVVPCIPEITYKRNLCFESVPKKTAIPCGGDGGTALLCSDKKGRFVVVGIFSYTFDYSYYLYGISNFCKPQFHIPVAIKVYPDDPINRDVMSQCSAGVRFNY